MTRSVDGSSGELGIYLIRPDAISMFVMAWARWRVLGVGDAVVMFLKNTSSNQWQRWSMDVRLATRIRKGDFIQKISHTIDI